MTPEELEAEGMAEPVVKRITSTFRTDGDGAIWWCPGCDDVHRVPIVDHHAVAGWLLTGTLDRPTLSPSVLVYSRERLNAAGHALLDAAGDGPTPEITDAHRESTPRCHSFVENGRIRFLSDSTHELAGQTVPMGPLPSYLLEHETRKESA